MESIKTTLRANLQAEHGPVTSIFNDEDKGFSICVHKYPDYVIYIRPNDRETHFLCHYAHREDLERTTMKNKERQEWRQQKVFQLRRSYTGGDKQCVAIVTDYVRQAVSRMELYREVSCRGFYSRILTFEEAKMEERMCPRPKRPNAAIPPPLCPRHYEVFKEAEKRKRVREDIGKREKKAVYVWKP
jgi:hypothetical protein